MNGARAGGSVDKGVVPDLEERGLMNGMAGARMAASGAQFNF